MTSPIRPAGGGISIRPATPTSTSPAAGPSEPGGKISSARPNLFPDIFFPNPAGGDGGGHQPSAPSGDAGGGDTPPEIELPPVGGLYGLMGGGVSG